MIKLKDILLEAKQVGNLYHFTSILNIFNILKTQHLLPNTENQISTSRSSSLNVSSFQDDKSDTPQCRLMLDGDKISNKYKIQPFKHFPDEESFEEQIIVNGKPFYFLPYLKRIDIFTGNSIKNKGIKLIPKLVKELEILNIPYKIYTTSTTNQNSYLQPKTGNPSNINFPKKVEILTLEDLYYPGMKLKNITTYRKSISDSGYIPYLEKVAESPKYPGYYIKTGFMRYADELDKYYIHYNKNGQKIKGIKMVPIPFLNDKSWLSKFKYLDNVYTKKFTPGTHPDAYLLIPKNEVNI